MKIKKTYSEHETEALGYELGLLLRNEPKVVILLDGDLGSGKTTFTKGLARAIGVTEIVNSPTYTIMNKVLYHLDLYRLDGVGTDFDLEEYIDGLGMIVVEWPYQAEELLPKDYLLIQIKKLGISEREFTLKCVDHPCKRAVQFI